MTIASAIDFERDAADDRALTDLVRAIDERGRAIWEKLEAVRMVLSEIETAFGVDAGSLPVGNATSSSEVVQAEAVTK